MVVFLVVDGEVVSQVQPTTQGKFEIQFSPSSLRLSGGTHVFQIYAVDAVGAIAPIASFSTVVLAPTPAQSVTADATKSPTPSATASASWGEIVDLPWYEDPGIDEADEGVSSIEVGKIIIGVGIPIGVFLIIAFAVLIHRYRRAVEADMNQRLKSSNASDAGATGLA
jgi:hypothetical protein